MNILLFILNPFIAFLNSLRNLTRRSNAVVFVLFCAMFGYCQHFQLVTSDIYRIGWAFYYSDNSFFSELIELYQQGESVDLYKTIVYSIVKSFTDNPKVLFAFFGLIFGFVCYLSIKLLLKERIGKSNIYFSLLIIAFFMFFSVVEMTGVRFATATWTFFYFFSKYFVYNNKKALLGWLITPLIHFGYFPVVICAVAIKLYLLFFRKKPLRLLFVLFIISFAVSFAMPHISLGDIDLQSSALEYKYDAYTATESYANTSRVAASGIRSNALYLMANNAITEYGNYMAKIMAFILCVIIYSRFNKVNKNQSTVILFAIVLFFFCFAFISSVFLDSVHMRYIWLSWLFLIYLLFRIYNENRDKIWKRCIIIIMPTALLYKIMFVFFNAPRLVTYYFWFMNLPFLIYDGVNYIPKF